MQRNYILFAIISVLIFGTWMLLIPKPVPPVKKSSKDKAPVAEEKKQPPLTPYERDRLLIVGAVGAPLLPGQLIGVIDRFMIFMPKPPEPVGKKEAAPVTEILGGDNSHLQVELTSQGAGVRRVTLTRFRAADYLGRPTEHKLDLVPDDPFQPSYLMYHYTDPKAAKASPVFGLGEQIWTPGAKKTAEDGTEEMSYSTMVPALANLKPHLKITKTYRLAPTDYHVGLTVKIEDTRPRDVEAEATLFRYQLAGAHGLPIEGEWYTSIFRNAVTLMVDPSGGLWRDLEDSARIGVREGGDRVPAEHRDKNRIQYAGVMNQYFGALIVVDDKQPPAAEGGVTKDNVLAFVRPTLVSTEKRGKILAIQGDELVFQDATPEIRRYRLLERARQHLEVLELKPGREAVINFYEAPRGELIVTWVHARTTIRPQFSDITTRVNSEVVEMKPGDVVAHQFMLYHGPVKVRLLKDFHGAEAVPDKLVERYIDTLHLNTMTDYPSNRFTRITYFNNLIVLFTNVMHWLLHWLHFAVSTVLPDVVSYGISIILLTVVVRGSMFPISRRQAMFSVKMQELAPELKKLGEKYKDDPQARTQATMELYRKHNIHPLGSCLPMLMQLPVFLGLYFCLQESIHFRLAPFLWIKNLAAPDMLIWWGEQIPWLSDPDHQGGVFYLGPFFNLLPVIAVCLMVVQQSLMTPPPTDEQQAMQQKMMKYMMIFFGVMFYKVAAGLCMYFIASSLWGLAERRLLPKKKLATALPLPPPSTNGPRAPGTRGKGKPVKPLKEDDESLVGRLKAWWANVLEQAKKK